MHKKFKVYGLYGICGSCFFLQLSTSGIALSCIVFIICWLTSGAVREILSILKKYPTAIIAILLFLMFCFGTIYTPVSFSVILDTLKEYRILLYIPIVMCLCENRREAPQYVLNSFLAGSFVALLASYLLFFGILPNKYSYAPTFHTLLSPTPHSGFMALFIFILLIKLLKKKKYAIYGVPIIILASYNLFFQVGSATGMVIFFALMLLLAFHYLSVKKITVICLVLGVLSSSLYYSSPKVVSELDEIVDTLQTYEIGSGTMRNNVSLRLDWWLSSYLLMREKPLIGHGTGAFEMVHNEFVKGTNIEPRSHPHNEYWYSGVQIGIPGVILFCLLLFAPFWASFQFKDQERLILQGIVVFFAIGNIFENWLIGSATGNFYVIMVAALLTSLQKRNVYT
jgi:O-antigen ligase